MGRRKILFLVILDVLQKREKWDIFLITTNYNGTKNLTTVPHFLRKKKNRYLLQICIKIKKKNHRGKRKKNTVRFKKAFKRIMTWLRCDRQIQCCTTQIRRNFSLRGLSRTEMVCWGKWWSHCPQKCSRKNWTWLLVQWSSWYDGVWSILDAFPHINDFMPLWNMMQPSE